MTVLQSCVESRELEMYHMYQQGLTTAEAVTNKHRGYVLALRDFEVITAEECDHLIAMFDNAVYG